MNIEDIKANIEENTYLSDYDKEELLNKLEEIVELQKSKDSKSKKWDKAKKILAFAGNTKNARDDRTVLVAGFWKK